MMNQDRENPTVVSTCKYDPFRPPGATRTFVFVPAPPVSKGAGEQTGTPTAPAGAGDSPASAAVALAPPGATPGQLQVFG